MSLLIVDNSQSLRFKFMVYNFLASYNGQDFILVRAECKQVFDILSITPL